MDRGEHVGDQQHEVDHGVGVERAVLHAVGERDALDQLHRDPRPAVVELAALVELRQPGVRDRGEDRRLAHHAVDRAIARELVLAQELERHAAPVQLVARAVHPAHPADAHEPLDAVGRDQVTGLERARCSVMVRSGRDFDLRADHDGATGSTPRASTAR